MTDDQKKQLGLLGLFGAAIVLLTRPKQAVRYSQGVGTMTTVQLAENFKELISSPVRIFINPTDESQPDTGTPWAVDLARYVKNYEAVKNDYQRFYGGNLSNDLIAWFSGPELSEFVAALWATNNQVMS